jgi:hypothetical protein
MTDPQTSPQGQKGRTMKINQILADRDRLKAENQELRGACEAALAYDKAIKSCANDPDKMASYCTAEGETLDCLYANWISKSIAAIAKAETMAPKDKAGSPKRNVK